MSGGKRYAINSVWDFLAVPEDRLDECLREFRIMLDMARNTVGLLDAVSDEVVSPGAIRWRAKSFEWIDDDARTVQINVLSTPAAPPTTHPVPDA